MTYQLTIRGEIGGWWGVDPAEIITYLRNNKDKPVNVAICSPGGFFDAGLEIYQAFRDHGNVHAHIIGLTASAATIIAMGAKEVTMVKNSLLLIHNSLGYVDGDGGYVNKERIEEMIARLHADHEDLKTFDDLIAGIYADRSGQTVDTIADLMAKGQWITSKRALELGLVDSIRDDAEAEKAIDAVHARYAACVFSPVAGLPPLPGPDSQTEKKPTALQQAAEAMRNIFSKSVQKTKSQIHTAMNKTFSLIAAFLGYEGFESKDNQISLSVDDMGRIEQKFKDDAAALAGAKEKAEKAEAGVKQRDEQIEQLNRQIEALQNGPGAIADPKPEPAAAPAEPDTTGALNLFNALCHD